jgi:hypothetical protein
MMRKKGGDRARRSENKVLYDSKDESELVRQQHTRSTPACYPVTTRVARVAEFGGCATGVYLAT